MKESRRFTKVSFLSFAYNFPNTIDDNIMFELNKEQTWHLKQWFASDQSYLDYEESLFLLKESQGKRTMPAAMLRDAHVKLSVVSWKSPATLIPECSATLTN